MQVPSFHSFRTRLLVFLLALLIPVLVGIYVYVTFQNQRYTDDTIDSYLQIGADVFDFSREEHKNTLLTLTGTLTRDWGFRNAFGAGDRATVQDATQTLLDRSRGSAHMMLIASMSGEVLVDTSAQGMAYLEGGWQALVDEARAHPEGIADAILTINDVPYQMTVVPLFLPTPVAWIFAGFAMDNSFVETVKQSVASEVSIVRYLREFPVGTETAVIASTLSGADQVLLVEGLDPALDSETQRLRLTDSDHGSLVRRLYGGAGDALEIVAVIQRSYRENEENLSVFQTRLLQFSVLVLLFSVAVSIMLSRTVTRPVLTLARRVGQIERGQFRNQGDGDPVRGRDEIAQLSSAVERMASGLEEKERVRNLLGKVVSREIAEELLNSPVELGGEERVVSVLFADLHGFTQLCEGESPARILVLLNHYLSGITDAIERCGGVVDKFSGDAVMALFGAPVAHDDDPDRAASAILAVTQAIVDVNDSIASGGRVIKAGIGLHTGLVVAGNMGSESRLNYSVIGDTVNTAARLESITRHYGVSNLVSDVSRNACSGSFEWREIDLVRVKGRREPIRIHELLGPKGSLSEQRLEQLRQFDLALQQYRAGAWDQARELFQALGAGQDTVLCQVFIDRIDELQVLAPSHWEGIHAFDHK